MLTLKITTTNPDLIARLHDAMRASALNESLDGTTHEMVTKVHNTKGEELYSAHYAPSPAPARVRPRSKKGRARTRSVWVVSFEPAPDTGGTGGFEWSPTLEGAQRFYDEGLKTMASPGENWALWEYQTDVLGNSEGDRLRITEQIDDLWVDGWPPARATVIARKFVSAT